MTYSIASESLGGGVCFQACLLVCKGLGVAHSIRMSHHFCFLWLAALWWETGKRKMAANNYYSFPLAGAQYGYKLIFLLRML